MPSSHPLVHNSSSSNGRVWHKVASGCPARDTHTVREGKKSRSSSHETGVRVSKAGLLVCQASCVIIQTQTSCHSSELGERDDRLFLGDARAHDYTWHSVINFPSSLRKSLLLFRVCVLSSRGYETSISPSYVCSSFSLTHRERNQCVKEKKE